MTTELIYELLLENDYVVLPGFGGFICQYNSAKLENIQHRILPPSRTIAFNKALHKNDGLLIQYVMLKNKCSYKEAENEVFQFITEIKSDLEKNGSIQFPKIGRVYTDKESSNTLFVAHHEFLPLDTSFGLSELALHPVSRVEESEKGSAIKITKVSGYRWPYWVAASIALLFVAGTFWLNLKDSSIDNVLTANLLPDYSINYVETNTVQKPIHVDNNSIRSSNLPLTYIDLQKVIEEEIAEETVVKESIYTIVVGAFRGPITAGKFVEDLKEQGYDARLLKGNDPTKLIKVLINYPAENADEALAFIKKSVEKDAWLLD